MKISLLKSAYIYLKVHFLVLMSDLCLMFGMSEKQKDSVNLEEEWKLLSAKINDWELKNEPLKNIKNYIINEDYIVEI